MKKDEIVQYFWRNFSSDSLSQFFLFVFLLFSSSSSSIRSTLSPNSLNSSISCKASRYLIRLIPFLYLTYLKQNKIPHKNKIIIDPETISDRNEFLCSSFTKYHANSLELLVYRQSNGSNWCNLTRIHSIIQCNILKI